MSSKTTCNCFCAYAFNLQYFPQGDQLVFFILRAINDFSFMPWNTHEYYSPHSEKRGIHSLYGAHRIIYSNYLKPRLQEFIFYSTTTDP